MGKRLRTWYKVFWQRVFGAGEWQGASEAWSPKRHTARAGESDAFVELDILDGFDRLVESWKREPDWLTAFKAKTTQMQWDHKYGQLTEATGNYTVAEVRALKYKLAIA